MACKADILKFCPNIQPGEGRIGDCIKEHISEISPKCIEKREQSNAEHEVKFGQTMRTCGAEDVKYCSDIKRFFARRINCLKRKYLENPNNFGPECRDAFAKIVEIIPPVYP